MSIPLFEFASAQRILFGAGRVAAIADLVVPLGRRVLVVTGRDPERAAPVTERLAGAGEEIQLLHVPGEPKLDEIRAGIELARTLAIEVVVGIGGGSALDAAKAIAILAGNSGDPVDYLEVIGGGKPLQPTGLPCLVVPTTAGTGAEVTRNAVIAVPEQRTKVSVRSPHMLPHAAIVDPELTYGLPPGLTAATGLDALTQLIEPFVSCEANPLTDAFAREGMVRSGRSLLQAYRYGNDVEARADLALAALLGGLALANARVGAVHALAAPIGGVYGAPHGAVCGRLLPFVTAANIKALRARAPQSPALARYDEVARLVTQDAQATAVDACAWIEALIEEMHVPTLASYGVIAEQFPELIVKAMRTSSMKGNPIALQATELQEALERAL